MALLSKHFEIEQRIEIYKSFLNGFKGMKYDKKFYKHIDQGIQNDILKIIRSLVKVNDRIQQFEAIDNIIVYSTFSKKHLSESDGDLYYGNTKMANDDIERLKLYIKEALPQIKVKVIEGEMKKLSRELKEIYDEFVKKLECREASASQINYINDLTENLKINLPFGEISEKETMYYISLMISELKPYKELYDNLSNDISKFLSFEEFSQIQIIKLLKYMRVNNITSIAAMEELFSEKSQQDIISLIDPVILKVNLP